MSAYTVEFESQRKLSAAEWLAIERGQISEVATRVNNALLSVVSELNGQTSSEKDLTHFAVLTNDLYWHLLECTGLAATLELKLAPVATVSKAKKSGPSKHAKPGAGGGGKFKAKTTTIGAAGDEIRSEVSKKKLTTIGIEMIGAYKLALRGLANGADPLPRVLVTMLRFLRSDIFEVRALTLMLFAHHLKISTGASSQQSAATAANELDAAVQRFMEPVIGRLYVDPSRTAVPADAMGGDVREWLRRLRVTYPFDGVRLAVTAPRIVWSTRYDDCLTEAPIRARANQRESIQKLHELARLGGSFLFMNRAPPGAGKSTLLAPISALLVGMTPPRELYVCAGQGRFGVTQFAQAIYAAGIPFSIAFMDHGKLDTRKQHSSDAPSRVFIGTADAICLLAKHPDRIGTADVVDLLANQPQLLSVVGAIKLLKRHPERVGVAAAIETLKGQLKDNSTSNAIEFLESKSNHIGWVVVDEPTYGADIAGSRPCREIMSLIAALPPVNRQLIMLGATLPAPVAMPNIVAHFGTATVVNGGLDSVQIACDVRTLSGRDLFPHTGCISSEDTLAIRNQVASRPFLARMYTVAALVRLRTTIMALGVSMAGAPDLDQIFNTAKGLRPAVVVATADAMLEFLATLPNPLIASVCAMAAPSHPPVNFGALATTHPADHQIMIVAVEPLAFALHHFKPLFDALRAAKVDVAASYAAFDRDREAAASASEAIARRRGAGEASTGNTGEEKHAGKKISFTETRKSGKGSADGTAEVGFIPDELDNARTTAKLNFPEWAQIGTAAHRARFGTCLTDTVCRAAIRPESVARGVVDIATQTLLLAGIGILSTRAVACSEYAAEVWRRASSGELAILLTDHSACYGANLQLGTVIITDEFAQVASTATLEQAGGRLCRVGLTYRGALVLPDAAADRLFADIRNATAATVEAANMEHEFVAALARGRKA